VREGRIRKKPKKLNEMLDSVWPLFHLQFIFGEQLLESLSNFMISKPCRGSDSRTGSLQHKYIKVNVWCPMGHTTPLEVSLSSVCLCACPRCEFVDDRIRLSVFVLSYLSTLCYFYLFMSQQFFTIGLCVSGFCMFVVCSWHICMFILLIYSSVC